MWQSVELTKILRRLGWKPRAIEDLNTALWCVYDSGQAAEDLVGAFIAYGCEYHVRKTAAAYTRELRRDELLPDARLGAGGPSADPGEETLPLFKQ